MSHGTKEHERMRLELEQFERDHEYIDNNYENLLATRGEVWIAVHQAEIVGEGQDAIEICNELKRKGIDTSWVPFVKLGAPRTITEATLESPQK